MDIALRQAVCRRRPASDGLFHTGQRTKPGHTGRVSKQPVLPASAHVLCAEYAFGVWCRRARHLRAHDVCRVGRCQFFPSERVPAFARRCPAARALRTREFPPSCPPSASAVCAGAPVLAGGSATGTCSGAPLCGLSVTRAACSPTRGLTAVRHVRSASRAPRASPGRLFLVA